MSRVDFYSIMKILKEGISPERKLGQVDLMYAMFHHYAEESGVGLDVSQVSRWFKGYAKVNSDITSYYLEKEDGREWFHEDIHNEIYKRLYEPSLIMKNLKELLTSDNTISPEKKRELQKHENATDGKERSVFIAELILFGLERPFVARGAKTEVTIEDGQSPDLSDYILNCDPPKPCPHFIGREKELEQLHKQLTEEKKVFVTGIGGIGKSELLKAYAQMYKKEYTNILYFLYSGDLKQDLTELDFVDDEGLEPESDRFKRHDRFLRALYEDTLIIVDNFDTTAVEESYLNELLRYRCRILFATRSVIEDQSQLPVGEIIEDEDLFLLVERFFPEGFGQRDIILEIINTVHRHTLAVELCARLFRFGLLDPEELLSKLREEHAGQASGDKVNLKKDNITRKDTYYGHIHTLFDLGCLAAEQTDVMRFMGLVPLSGITKRFLAGCMEKDNLNALNDLIELGLIRELEGRLIGLHPMVREIVLADLKPSVKNCRSMLEWLKGIYNLLGIEFPYRRKVLEVTTCIIRDIISDDDEDLIIFLEDAISYAETYTDKAVIQLAVDRLESLLSDEGIGSMKDRALLFDAKAMREWMFRKDFAKAREYQEQAIRFLPEPDDRNAIASINVLNNMSIYCANAKPADYEKAREYLARCLEILNRYPEFQLTHDRMMVEINYAVYGFKLGEQEESLSVLEKWLGLIKNSAMKDSLDEANLEETLASLLMQIGKKKEAAMYVKDAYRIFEKLIDDEVVLKGKKLQMKMICSEAGVDVPGGGMLSFIIPPPPQNSDNDD